MAADSDPDETLSDFNETVSESKQSVLLGLSPSFPQAFIICQQASLLWQTGLNQEQTRLKTGPFLSQGIPHVLEDIMQVLLEQM